MKTKQIILRLTVPEWLPGPAYWNRVKLTWKTIKYKLNPCKCVDCGVALDFRQPDLRYPGDDSHKRVLLSCSLHRVTDDKHKGLCGRCLANRIRTAFAKAKPASGEWNTSTISETVTHKRVCDCCGETKQTLDVCWDPECDIRFGVNWWNGHHICEECLCLTAEQGIATSGQIMFIGPVGGYSLNHIGAVIGLEHWYDLLVPTKERTNDI